MLKNTVILDQHHKNLDYCLKMNGKKTLLISVGNKVYKYEMCVIKKRGKKSTFKLKKENI